MKKVIVLAALLALTACGEKKAATPAADSTAAMDSTMQHDSMMGRDSAHAM